MEPKTYSGSKIWINIQYILRNPDNVKVVRNLKFNHEEHEGHERLRNEIEKE